MTRERKLREILNVRLDQPLARELARIAGAQNRSESEVARTLLSYGIEVVRRLEVDAFKRPFEWQLPEEEDAYPEIVEIQARWRRMTDVELAERDLWSYASDPVEPEESKE
jgi:hypothetical protein